MRQYWLRRRRIQSSLKDSLQLDDYRNILRANLHAIKMKCQYQITPLDHRTYSDFAMFKTKTATGLHLEIRKKAPCSLPAIDHFEQVLLL
jgi:hypothetical protein